MDCSRPTPRPSEILRHAAELVLLGWTQGKLARTATSEPTNFSDDKAVKFCPYGALSRATYNICGGQRIEHPENGGEPIHTGKEEPGDAYLEAVRWLRTIIARKTGEQPETVDIAGWNDATGQNAETVASTLQEAASEAETGERPPAPPPSRPSFWTKLGRMLQPKMHDAT